MVLSPAHPADLPSAAREYRMPPASEHVPHVAPSSRRRQPANSARMSVSPRWLALALTGAGIGQLPWMFYLAVSLPASPQAWHWPAAWVGLDAMEAAGLLTTGFLLLRRDARYCLTAAATAAMLVADAWFDVTTAQPGSAELSSAAMAAFAEVPGSALCIVLAARGLRRLLAADGADSLTGAAQHQGRCSGS